MKKIFLFTSIILLLFSTNIFSQPTNLSTNNITSNSADLNWDASTCPGNVTLHYKVSGTSWPGTSVNQALSPYSISGLSSSTNYEWRVKCGGTSSWSSIQQFSTLCTGTLGCTDLNACNYDAAATCDDGSCTGLVGCIDLSAANYNPLATCGGGNCIYIIYGCNDSLACNYNALANINDGSCITQDGCTDSIALNYDPIALCDDGSCDYPIYGCTDNLSCNFNQLASIDDGSCLNSFGCTLPAANNYDPLANCNDGSCTFNGLGISNAIISSPIECNGGFTSDSMQVTINQTSPLTQYICLVGYHINNTATPNLGADFFISYVSTQNTTANQLNLNGFLPTFQFGANSGQTINYFVRIVDSASYYPAHTNGNGSSMIGVVDQFGPINFIEPDPLIVNTSLLSNNLCVGDCIAKEKIIINGGTKPYSYILDANPQLTLGLNVNTTTISSLCTGTYNLVVTDANGCSTTPTINSFTIQPLSPIIPAGTASLFNSNGFNISCNGLSDGTIIASASGGAEGFVYSIDGINFQSYPVFSGLPAGNHTITYKDANGCIANEVFTLSEPPALSGVSSILEEVDCYDQNTGKITFNITPIQTGVPPYAYSIDNGASFQTSNVFSNLFGGINYPLTVEDDNGCSFTDSIFLPEPSEIIYSTTVSNYNGFGVSCNSDNDGTITVSATGGTATLTYSLDGTSFQTATLFSGLQSGTQIVYIRDGNGCTIDTNIVLTEPGLFSISTFSSDYNGADVSCFGSSNGEIFVTESNGVNQVLYEFNNSGVLNTVNNWDSLSSGSYNIYAEDLNGCSDSQTVIIIDPPLLTTNLSVLSNEYCNNANGEIEAITIGGTGAISYSWSNGQNNSIASGLIAGNYQCIVADVNGCSVSVSANIIDDIPYQIISTSTPSCYGASQGTASVSLIANGSYILNNPSFLWNDPSNQTSPTANNLASGSYNVTVNDLNCSIDAIVVVDTPSIPLFIESIDISQITCNNANNGEIIVHASGAAPYSFALNSNTSTNDSIFSNLSAGSYQVTVEDASGCIDTQNVNIINPDIISVGNITIDSISCFGECDASIIAIQASGGTPFNSSYSYLYSVNGGLPHPNTSYFNGYCADTYTVQVRDANDCVSSTLLIISEPDELTVNISTSLWNNYQIRCHGGNSGSANITVNGGTTPYDINYYEPGNTSPIATTSIVTGLSAGTYGFEVKDANECTYTENINFNQPDPINHNFIATHVSCSGWSNGVLIDSIWGGVGNSSTYNYSWNNGANTYSLTNIPVGTYTMTVTDENNCVSVASYTINDNLALNSTSTTINVSCFDYCDGEIVVNTTGGSPNIDSNGNPFYYYQWNDTLLQTTSTAIGLCVDNNSLSTTYECVITDMLGCTVIVSETVNQPTQLVVNSNIVEEILCYGGSNGKLNATAAGGSGSYQYMWSNNAPNYSTNSTNNGVIAGDYIITVVDAEGCTSSDFISLTEPTELSLITNETSITCLGFDDGRIEAIAENGTPFLGIPPEYLYTVTNEETGIVVYTNTTVIGNAYNLSPGIYTIIAEDRNGCTTESGTIYISEPGDSLTITFNTIDASCLQNNGSASVVAYGGTPAYQYNWDNNITAASNVNLAAGYYPITVIDSRGCEKRDSAFVKGTHNVFADSLSEITFNICLGDSVFIAINETPFNNYVWENGSLTTDRWVYPNDYTNIYTLTIEDPTCTSSYDVTATVNVDFIDPMLSSSPGVEYGNFPIVLSGNNLDLFSNNNDCVEYTWRWSQDTITNNNGSISIYDLQKTNWYYLHVKDDKGCLGYDSIYVVVGVLPYEAITPNNDGFNDIWAPLDIQSYENALVQVFNRWGGIVFESNGGESYQGWDGTNKGEELPVGTYYYIIDLNTGDNPQTGPITIIR